MLVQNTHHWWQPVWLSSSAESPSDGSLPTIWAHRYDGEVKGWWSLIPICSRVHKSGCPSTRTSHQKAPKAICLCLILGRESHMFYHQCNTRDVEISKLIAHRMTTALSISSSKLIATPHDDRLVNFKFKTDCTLHDDSHVNFKFKIQWEFAWIVTVVSDRMTTSYSRVSSPLFASPLFMMCLDG